MSDPFDKGTARPPATLGEGCLNRYDLEQLSDDAGTEFADAAELWRAMHPAQPGAALPQADQEDVQTDE